MARSGERGGIVGPDGSPASAGEQAVGQGLATLYGIQFRQQAEAIRALLKYWIHPTIEAGSLEHFNHQMNTFVVLAFESAGRWGVPMEELIAKGAPIWEAENAKRLEREAAAATPPVDEPKPLSV